MSSTLQEGQALSRRERERLRRRRAMLEAARAVFAEKGYAHATLDEIAERAEFGKGTLYNYFEGGKEEILFAIFDRIYSDLRALIEESLSSEHVHSRPLREAFHAFVEAYFRFFLEREELFLILMKEEMQFLFSEDEDKAAYFHEQQEHLVEALVPPLEAAIEDGELKPLPPQAVAHMIQGNIKGVLMHVAMAGHHRPEACQPTINTPEEAADFLTTILLDGMLISSETPSEIS